MKLSEIISPLVADGTRQCSETRAFIRPGQTGKTKAIVAFLPSLRLLIGSLYALLQIVLELEADETESTPDLKLDLQIFDGCRELIALLRDFTSNQEKLGVDDNDEDQDGLVLDPAYEVIVQAYREEINHTILSADVSNLTSLKLRLDLFQHRRAEDPWNLDPVMLERPEVDTPVVCWWLNLLNADEANREPAEYHKEEAYRKRRRIVSPDYQIAVQDWPHYASRLWDATEEECAISTVSQEKNLPTWPTRFQSLKSLGYDRVERTKGTIASQILELFGPERKWNFVQWLLEFIETKVSPLDWGSLAGREELVAWTEELCKGPIPYLQVAAALGLSGVVEKLLNGEKGVKETYVTMSIPDPAICAMIGPIALLPGRFSKMDEIEVCEWENTSSRRRTIELLTSPSRRKAKPWVYETQVYLPGTERRITASQLLFQMAQQELDPSIFYQLPDSHMDVDAELMNLISDEIEETQAKYGPKKSGEWWVNEAAKSMAERHRQAKLLFMRVYDWILEPEEPSRIWSRDLIDVIDDHLSNHGLPPDHGIEHNEQQIPWLDTIAIHQRAKYALRTDHPYAFKRYIADKRFSFAHPVLQAKDGRSLLHGMVGSDQTDLVKQLLEKDRDRILASLNGQNSSGQTPLMLAESSEMLEILIDEFGADTTIADHLGRNVWHLMAGSNDIEMVRALHEHDPCKDQNIAAVSNLGNTPLAMALLYVKEWPAVWLQHQFGARLPSLMDVAEIITYCGSEPESFVSQTPLTHLVAEWTSPFTEHNEKMESMIKRLQSVQLDFKALDANGKSPLFHLSLNQTPEIIKKFCELCSGTPLIDNNKVSLLTAVFENMFPRPITNKDTYEVAATPLPFLRPAYPGAFKSLLENSGISSTLTTSRDGLVWDTTIKTFLSFAKKAIRFAKSFDISTVPEIVDVSEAMLEPLLATFKAVLSELVAFDTASHESSTDGGDKTRINSIKQYEDITGTSAFGPFAELTLSEDMEGYDPVWEVILPRRNQAQPRRSRVRRLTSETVGVDFFMRVKEIAMPHMDQQLLRTYFESAGMLARANEPEQVVQVR